MSQYQQPGQTNGQPSAGQPGQAYDQPAEDKETGVWKIIKEIKRNAYLSLGGLFYCGVGILFLIFFFLCKVYIIGIGAFVFILMGISCFERLSKKIKQHDYSTQFFGDVVIFLLAMYIMIGMPARLNSTDTKKYAGYKNYLNAVLGTDVLFPYYLPDSIDSKSFKIVNKNKAWGKSSWSSVRFKVDTDSKAWEKMVKEKYTNREKNFKTTHYEGTLAECLRENSRTEDLRFLYDEDFWAGYEEDSYVMNDENYGTDKKPASKIIIINPKEGMIEFTQLNLPVFKR